MIKCALWTNAAADKCSSRARAHKCGAYRGSLLGVMRLVAQNRRRKSCRALASVLQPLGSNCLVARRLLARANDLKRTSYALFPIESRSTTTGALSTRRLDSGVETVMGNTQPTPAATSPVQTRTVSKAYDRYLKSKDGPKEPREIQKNFGATPDHRDRVGREPSRLRVRTLPRMINATPAPRVSYLTRDDARCVELFEMLR